MTCSYQWYHVEERKGRWREGGNFGERDRERPCAWLFLGPIAYSFSLPLHQSYSCCERKQGSRKWCWRCKVLLSLVSLISLLVNIFYPPSSPSLLLPSSPPLPPLPPLISTSPILLLSSSSPPLFLWSSQVYSWRTERVCGDSQTWWLRCALESFPHYHNSEGSKREKGKERREIRERREQRAKRTEERGGGMREKGEHKREQWKNCYLTLTLFSPILVGPRVRVVILYTRIAWRERGKGRFYITLPFEGVSYLSFLILSSSFLCAYFLYIFYLIFH